MKVLGTEKRVYRGEIESEAEIVRIVAR